MSLIHNAEEGWDSAFQIVAEYLARPRRLPPMISGGQKTQEKYQDGFNDGRSDMILEVVCAEVYRRRVDKYQHWKSVPILGHYDARKIVELLKSAYEGSQEEVQTDTTKVNDAKMTNWETFTVNYEAIINDAAFPQELTDREVDRHREAVLGDFETPNADDIAWLVEEQGKAADKARALAKLSTLAERTKETGV